MKSLSSKCLNCVAPAILLSAPILTSWSVCPTPDSNTIYFILFQTLFVQSLLNATILRIGSASATRSATINSHSSGGKLWSRLRDCFPTT